MLAAPIRSPRRRGPRPCLRPTVAGSRCGAHAPTRCTGFTLHPLTLTTKTSMVDNTQEPCNRLRGLGGYMKGTYNLPAPGELETVRKLMNTWLVPSATQIPEDRLPALLRDQEAWRREFPDVPLGADDSAESLAKLRDDLRRMVGGGRRLARIIPAVAGAVPASGRSRGVRRGDEGATCLNSGLGGRGLDTRRHRRRGGR